MNNIKNKFAAAAAGVLLLSVLGCSFLRSGDQPSSGSNRTTADDVVDSTVGKSNTGIVECDQVLDTIEAELQNPDDNFIVKAAKATILNQIKDAIKQSIQENPADKEQLAKGCKEFKTEVDKALAEQKAKQ
ncbi:MAG: hypothetical protein AB7Q37_07650 [Pyrinomonadaceae bacterium]